MKLTTTIDVQLGRGQNMREGWHATAGRKDKEKKATRAALPSLLWDGSTMASHMTDDRGARITVVRPYSPSSGPMDTDNLSGSFKYPRDEIAAFLGVDDGSPRLHFIYTQAVAVKLGMSVKKGRTKASPDYDTRPTVTIEVLPVADIDPQVKRVRELERQLQRWEAGWVGTQCGPLAKHAVELFDLYRRNGFVCHNAVDLTEAFQLDLEALLTSSK